MSAPRAAARTVGVAPGGRQLDRARRRPRQQRAASRRRGGPSRERPAAAASSTTATSSATSAREHRPAAAPANEDRDTAAASRREVRRPTSRRRDGTASARHRHGRRDLGRALPRASRFSSSASAVSSMRCAQHGTRKRLTSSGTTKSRPAASAPGARRLDQRERAARTDSDLDAGRAAHRRRRASRRSRAAPAPTCTQPRRPAQRGRLGAAARPAPGSAASGVPAGERARDGPPVDLDLGRSIGQAHVDANQEAVELRLGQRIGPLELDRVLRRDHEERRRRAVRDAVDRRPASPASPRAGPTASWAACG